MISLNSAHADMCLQTGVCVKDLHGHTEIVTALEWLPDGSGFISAGMDSRIIFWVSESLVGLHALSDVCNLYRITRGNSATYGTTFRSG